MASGKLRESTGPALELRILDGKGLGLRFSFLGFRVDSANLKTVDVNLAPAFRTEPGKVPWNKPKPL